MPTIRPRLHPKRPRQQLPPPSVPMKGNGSPSISSSSSSPPRLRHLLYDKQIPVPIPPVKLPTQQQPKGHYPFPVTPIDDPSALSPHHTTA
ncbi:hypothetical protein BYT27DRAFT_7262545 [Phlegmacium glaucopus]|nr:hypothetical protein BYT27DRAFT_7262545 [Phlegmacium glaucopus]